MYLSPGNVPLHKAGCNAQAASKESNGSSQGKGDGSASVSFEDCSEYFEEILIDHSYEEEQRVEIANLPQQEDTIVQADADLAYCAAQVAVPEVDNEEAAARLLEARLARELRGQVVLSGAPKGRGKNSLPIRKLDDIEKDFGSARPVQGSTFENMAGAYMRLREDAELNGRRIKLFNGKERMFQCACARSTSKKRQERQPIPVRTFRYCTCTRHGHV